eukprot:2881241-Rhodomonas_salina.2
MVFRVGLGRLLKQERDVLVAALEDMSVQYRRESQTLSAALQHQHLRCVRALQLEFCSSR